MTLILTVANPGGIYQSSDYQLTDSNTGAPVSDQAGSKQLEANVGLMHLQLAFTGVAIAPSGQRTVDWLAAELTTLQKDATLKQLCNALATRATLAMKPYGSRGVLTLVLGVAQLDTPFRVVTISNSRWGSRPPKAKNYFDISVETITKPFHLISGYQDSVPLVEQHRLRALARALDRSATDITDVLASVNARAAPNSNGYVSEGCWTTSRSVRDHIYVPPPGTSDKRAAWFL